MTLYTNLICFIFMSRRKRKKNIPHREQSIPEADSKSSPKLAKKFFLIGLGTWKVFCIFVLIVGFLATILNLSPKISLSPSPPLDPSDLFSTPFTVFNDGQFPVWNVKFTTLLNQVKNEGRVTWDNISVEIISPKPVASYLSQGDATTFSVPFRKFFGNVGAIDSADIEITINYQPFPMLWYKEKPFRFVALKYLDGRLSWFRMPIDHKK